MRVHYIPCMDKDLVIAKLREHQDELRAAGAEHVSIFGSVARGEATEGSDLDLLVTFSEPVTRSGLGFIGAMSDLKALVDGITGAQSVDIVPGPVTPRSARGERLHRNIERDRADAY